MNSNGTLTGDSPINSALTGRSHVTWNEVRQLAHHGYRTITEVLVFDPNKVMIDLNADFHTLQRIARELLIRGFRPQWFEEVSPQFKYPEAAVCSNTEWLLLEDRIIELHRQGVPYLLVRKVKDGPITIYSKRNQRKGKR